MAILWRCTVPCIVRWGFQLTKNDGVVFEPRSQTLSPRAPWNLNFDQKLAFISRGTCHSFDTRLRCREIDIWVLVVIAKPADTPRSWGRELPKNSTISIGSVNILFSQAHAQFSVSFFQCYVVVWTSVFIYPKYICPYKCIVHDPFLLDDSSEYIFLYSLNPELLCWYSF